MPPATFSRLSTHVVGSQVQLHYLNERDHVWLACLLDEYQRGVGSKRSELLTRLREPLRVRAPKTKQRLAIAVVQQLADDRVLAHVPPREARFKAFCAAATQPGVPRPLVLEQVAAELGLEVPELEATLFADLPSERAAGPLPPWTSPAELAAEVNVRLVTSWLMRARSLRVRAWGNTHALVRQARRHGLICSVRRAATAATPDAVELDVSGPLSLFRHTRLYGRALCGLLPRALDCDGFELHVCCEAGTGLPPLTLLVGSTDPIRPARELKPFDNKLERRFAREFRKAAPDWELVLEPAPLEAAGVLIFPDFELVSRRDPTRRFLLEIVGFWTPKYLEEKLARLRQASIDNLILCLDQRRACSEAPPSPANRVVAFERRIDVAKVLALLDEASAR